MKIVRSQSANSLPVQKELNSKNALTTLHNPGQFFSMILEEEESKQSEQSPEQFFDKAEIDEPNSSTIKILSLDRLA